MFEVCEKRCDQCLFSNDRIVSKSRMASIVKDCRRKDTHFICHKHSEVGGEAMCRGYFETQPPPQMLRIAGRLGMIKFVPEPSPPTRGQADE